MQLVETINTGKQDPLGSNCCQSAEHLVSPKDAQKAWHDHGERHANAWNNRTSATWSLVNCRSGIPGQ